MSLIHANEKFSSAQGILLTGQGNIRERLKNAAMDVLQVKTGDPELPNSLQTRIESLQYRLTWGDQDEHRDGKLGATLRQTSDSECSEIADEIGEIANALHSELRSRIDYRSNEPESGPNEADKNDLVM